MATPILCCLGSYNKTPTSDYSISNSNSSAYRTNSSESRTNNTKILNSPSGRQIVVDGLKQMAIESGKSILYDKEGIEGKTLSIESNNLESIDCLRFSESDYGKFAASKGFDKVICRNNRSDKQWSYILLP